MAKAWARTRSYFEGVFSVSLTQQTQRRSTDVASMSAARRRGSSKAGLRRAAPARVRDAAPRSSGGLQHNKKWSLKSYGGRKSADFLERPPLAADRAERLRRAQHAVANADAPAGSASQRSNGRR